MRRVVLFAMAVVVASACSSESVRSPAQPESISLPLRVTTAQHAGEAHNQSVHLSGDQEVFTPATPGGPTPADSRAQGQAIIQIVRDGDSFSYKLIVSNIENVVQAPHPLCARGREWADRRLVLSQQNGYRCTYRSLPDGTTEC